MGDATQRDLTDRTGRRVRFRMRDVYVPDAARLREELSGDWELVGTLVAFSDSGDRPGEFGIVQLADGVDVVVPVLALTEVRDGAEAT